MLRINAFNQSAIRRYNTDVPLHWVRAWSLTHACTRYLPLTYCYANTPFTDEHFCRWSSNGNAAGNTLEEAILQGFFELVERDACAIWWYNKIRCPGVDPGLVAQSHLDRIHQSLGGEWDYWLLDLTHDFKIPVIAAIGQHQQSKKFGFGFGCHLNRVMACQRALTELCQIIPIRSQNAAPFDFDRIEPEAYLFPNTGRQSSVGRYADGGHADFQQAIAICMDMTARRGMELIVLDYSRPELPLHAVKVMVPGLCHIWPQLGNPRLYQVPVDLHWCTHPRQEKSLNPLNLYI